jgi:hypothetical protein
LGKNYVFRILGMLLLLSSSAPWTTGAHAAEDQAAASKPVLEPDLNEVSSEILDVNLNSIYLKERTQKEYNTLGEIILQLPYPISDAAKKTGQGPFGGITYFDDKTVLNTTLQGETVYGLGRLYYSTTVPGQTPLIFIPYLTFYRELQLEYKDPAGSTTDTKKNAWLTPGFMSSYRITRKLIGHADMEAYSYSKPQNNRERVGFSYLPRWPLILSASYERLAWDLDGTVNGNGYFAQGNSGEFSAKIIVRNPPQGNFALILGYGTLHTAAVPGFAIPESNPKGTYFGIEASAGVLAW